MGSGEDAGALASPAQETGDDGPAVGAEDAGPVAAAGDDAPVADATDKAPVAAEADGSDAGAGDDARVAGAGDKAPVADEPGAPEPAASDGDLPGPVPAPEEPGHSRGAPVWVAGMAALLAVLIAGIVVAVVFLGHVNSSDAQNSRRQAAVAAARTAATDLTAADYQHPQEYIGKLKGVATGNFLKLITNSSSGFASVLAQGKVQTSGRVVDVGVQKIGTDTAQLSVLAYVTVKNSQSPNGSERAYRLSVSMISAGSRWLVSNVEFVQ